MDRFDGLIIGRLADNRPEMCLSYEANIQSGLDAKRKLTLKQGILRTVKKVILIVTHVMNSIAHATTNVPAYPFITRFAFLENISRLWDVNSGKFLILVFWYYPSPFRAKPHFLPHPKKLTCPLIKPATSVADSFRTLQEIS